MINADRDTSAIARTLSCGAVRAVTFQGPGEVRLEERPEPEPIEPDDAVVRVEATGICGSDLHIYHGRVAIEPGFVIGHEYVGTVVAAGDAVSEVAVGDRVLGTYCTACGAAFTAGGASTTSATREGSSATAPRSARSRERRPTQVLVPTANLTLRRVPDGLSDEVALFAGDVAGTGLPRDLRRRRAARSARAGSDGRGPRPRPGGPLRRSGGPGLRRVAHRRRRLGRGAARDGGVVRGRAGPPHRGATRAAASRS